MAPMGLEGIVSNPKMGNRKEEEEDRLTSLLPFEIQLVTCEGSKVNESVYQIERKNKTHIQKKREWINIFPEKRNTAKQMITRLIYNT